MPMRCQKKASFGGQNWRHNALGEGEVGGIWRGSASWYYIRCPWAFAMPHAIQQYQKGRCNAMQYNGTAQRQRKSYVMLLLLYMIALACHAIELIFFFFFIQFCS